MRLLLALLGVWAAAGATGLDSAVTEYDLANGLHVILYVDSSAPVVSTHVWYRVGAYDESRGLTGISHMVEHMTFKHTDRYEPGTFHRTVDEAGGYNNGFTSNYYTGYYEDLARDRWELALELEAARMARCIFDPEEFETEHQVVTEEWRLGQNNPSRRHWQTFEELAYVAHPHRQPIIGWGDDIARFTVDRVREWYERHYDPANAVVVVAGDIRPGAARKLVDKHFARLRGRPVERTDFYNLEPEQDGERRAELRLRTRNPSLLVGYRIPGFRDTADYYAGEVLGAILGGGQTSRLYRRLVTRDGLATGVWANAGVTLDPDLLYISVRPRSEEDIPAIERAIDEEIARLADGPVPDIELARVRNQVLAGHVFAQDRVSTMARVLAANYLVHGDWRVWEQYPAGIGEVTGDRVRQFARDYLRTTRRTVVALLPEEQGS